MVGFYRGELWKRLKEAWPLWWVIFGVLGAFMISCFLANDSVTVFRYAGLLLEIFGLGLVVIGLDHIRQQFGKEPFRASITKWFLSWRAVFTGPEPVQITGKLGTLFTENATANLSMHGYKDQTIEERLETLEGDIKRLQGELNNKTEQLKQEIASVKADFDEKIENTIKIIDDVDSRVKDYAVGGMGLEVVGLVWISLGIILASIPDELGMLFGAS
ncbi:ABC transporter C-terminal domain-containing protein [Tautonia rosea]|uniref:ABC transporter C-terminal domain-containing protein n=1 Tax=Tautonia rosea TaxID=2728037 RepID=UPI00147462EB|nr:ABC transporter C-terminal domain-containing protein [Tautonia rosea]